MKLIGWDEIEKHFKGLVKRDTIRRWMKDYEFPYVKTAGDRGCVCVDSDAADEWYTRFTLRQTGLPEKVVDRLMEGPKTARKRRAK